MADAETQFRRWACPPPDDSEPSLELTHDGIGGVTALGATCSVEGKIMGADRARRKMRGGSIDMEWEEKTRRKIQTSMIANRLIDYVNGKIKLEPAQVTAAVALMRKCLPDLTASEIKGDVVHKFAVVPEVMEKERWLATRGNPSLLPTDDPDRKLNKADERRNQQSRHTSGTVPEITSRKSALQSRGHLVSDG
jgi:hypothetical protein